MPAPPGGSNADWRRLSEKLDSQQRGVGTWGVKSKNCDGTLAMEGTSLRAFLGGVRLDQAPHVLNQGRHFSSSGTVVTRTFCRRLSQRFGHNVSTRMRAP